MSTPDRLSSIRRTISDYLLACQARGLSPKTLKDNYRFPLERVFVPFLEREGIAELRAIDQRALNRLSVELQEKGPSGRPLSVFSVNSYLNSTNLFLAWAAREGEMDKLRAQTPRLPRRVLETLSREDIDKLEQTASTERDKLIVRLLADTGLRASELLGLKVGDLIQRDRQYLLRVVNAKGRRERLVPVPPADFRRLLRLARGRESDERVFRSLRRSRTGGDYSPLHIAGLEQMLETLGESASLQKRVYPHLLRHSFATWALTRGMNPIQLAQILGHTSLRMINNVYSHLTVADAYEALMKVIAAEA